MLREPHASLDFETASAAGVFWDGTKLLGPPGAGKGKRGLPVVGVVAYAQHPSTRILTLSWKLPTGVRGRWKPGDPLSKLQPFLDWHATGGMVGAHSIAFEWYIWHEVAVRDHGFPPLTPHRLTCSMAAAHINGFPGKLAMLGPVLGLPVLKDGEGRRLINKFSVPNKPTKSRPTFWIRPEDEPEDFAKFEAYCDTDVDVEALACEVMPPMTPEEREFWLVDQEINRRGIAINRAAVRDCIAVLEQVLEIRGQEFKALVGFEPTQLEKFKGWLAAMGVYTDSLDAEHLEELLKRKDLPAPARTALEIRDLIGSASVKKLYAMENQASRENRLHNLILHHGARTGRPTGEGPQPLNLPKAGPKLATCQACAQPFHPKHASCPWCGVLRPPPSVEREKRLTPAWRPEMVAPVLDVMATRSMAAVEHYYGDAVTVIMGVVRGLFEAGPRHHLVASDYSAIEAVVTALLSGEEWRIETFRRKEDIYIYSAGKITGNSPEFYAEYLAATGDKHPDRQYIGKVAELALGFGGWLGAWRNFDSSDKYTDQEVKDLILAWRKASPKVVDMWGGQSNQDRTAPHLYGFEGAFIMACRNPGVPITACGITFTYEADDALRITLLSGRKLTYWQPRLNQSERPYARPWELQLSYMTFNTNPKYGPKGWVRMQTYGGRLTENIVQATAHCILRYAILGLRAAGLPTVLHVYDEIVCEVPAYAPPDTLAEVERIMAIMPPWAAGWPVRASGGWRGIRYRKD